MPRRHTPQRHDRYKPDLPCQRKRRFKSEADALQAIETAALYDIRVELLTYACPYCTGWHLSSVKSSK